MKPRRLSSSTLLCLLYAAYIVYGGTVPFHFTADPSFVTAKLAHLPLNPLIEPDTGRRLSLPDVTQNILFFLPFGVLGALARRARGASAARSVAQVILLGTVLSLVVETMQLVTLDRVTSASDVLADTLGAGLGALIAVTALSSRLARIRATLPFAELGSSQAFVLAGTLAFLCISAWVPFDFTIDVSTVTGHARALQADLWQVGPWFAQNPGLSLLGPALVAVATAISLDQKATIGAAVVASVVALAASILATVAQVLVGSRLPGLAGVTAGVVGPLLGAAWWFTAETTNLPRSSWALTLVAGTFAAQLLDVAALGLSGHRPQGFGPFPGSCSADLFVITWRGFGQALLYLPVGFALVRGRGGQRGVLVAITLALVGGMAVEAIRRLAGCRFDALAVASGAAGAWLGCLIGTQGQARWTALLETVQQS